MSLRALSGTAVLLLAVAGCGGGGGTKSIRQPRGMVTVEKGQTLVLAFANNPGVGFQWERGTPNPDPAVLPPRGSSSESADRPGANVEIRYRFEARRAGTTAIGFVHFFRGKAVERRTVRVRVVR